MYPSKEHTPSIALMPQHVGELGASRSVSEARTTVENGNVESMLLYHSRGFDILRFCDIVRLQAERNYTAIKLVMEPDIVVAHTLHEFEAPLCGGTFLRTHKSHIINLQWLKGYVSDDAGYAIMRNGDRVEVARRRMPEFIKRISMYTTHIGQ